MSQTLSFGNTILPKSGKRGILKPMEPGGHYYLLNAGGFNIPNRMGIKYTFNDYVRECMGPDSDLNRRVSEGQVQCELGHPPQYYFEYKNGVIVQTAITEVFAWIHRLRTVLEPHVCGSIRKIHWEITGGPRDPVYNKIEVRPFGIHKQVMQDSLDDPDMNTAFSIRTVTKPQKLGDMVREVEYFSTYDMVIEQGMLHACKHRTAGLEDLLTSQLAVSDVNAEMTASFDEFLYVMERDLAKDSMMSRFAGTESHNRVMEMVKDLKRRHHHNDKVAVVRTSSALGLFR